MLTLGIGVKAVIMGQGAFSVRPRAITAAQRGFTGFMTFLLCLVIRFGGFETIIIRRP